MTEEKAKTKWCPQMRLVDTRQKNASFNAITDGKYGDEITYGCCIASDCMLWVWDYAPHDLAVEDPRALEFKGRCGLAR